MEQVVLAEVAEEKWPLRVMLERQHKVLMVEMEQQMEITLVVVAAVLVVLVAPEPVLMVALEFRQQLMVRQQQGVVAEVAADGIPTLLTPLGLVVLVVAVLVETQMRPMER